MAPMADVTDPAFRALVAKRGKPDVFWTEFVSADGLFYTRQKMKDSENPLMRDLQFSEAERPIVAQIFSSKPEMIEYGAKLIKELGFDGVDLNMGCPAGPVEKQGAGAALIKSPERAVKLIKAAQLSGLPVSVKTRIGYNTDVLEEWLGALLSAGPVAITLHLRTRKQMSAVPADWVRMKKAVELRNARAPSVLLIGNGDVESLEQGRQLARETGADGIMIGRGMFGNPWVFSPQSPRPSSQQKLETLLELARNFEKLSPPKSFAILKKHIKAFVTGFDGAAELRAQLMTASSASELGDKISAAAIG